MRGYSHKLGECGITFFAASALVSRLSGEFPACLDGAPLLVPGEGTALRGQLMRWLAHRQLYPRIAGEFDDSALMHAFGQGGSGVFPVPDVIADEIRRQHNVEVLGRTDDVMEHFYAISVERRLSHPAVLAVLETASRELFGADVSYPPASATSDPNA